MNDRKLMQCILCNKRFSEKDVEELRYFPEQGICFKDYYDGFKQDHRTWCFGKRNTVDPDTGKITRYGFDPQKSDDCKKLCPDRKVCRLFVSREIFRYRKLLKLKKLPFPRGTALLRIFVTCVIGISPEKLKEKTDAEGLDLGKVMKTLRGLKWEMIETTEKIRIKLV